MLVSNESLMRPMYRVRDTAGKLSLLAFYLNNGNKDAARVAKFRTGTTLVIEQPWAKIFADGQHGIRLEDEDVNTVTVRDHSHSGVPELGLKCGAQNLPCNLAELRESHNYLRAAPKDRKGCGKKQPAKRCSRCLVPYCGAVRAASFSSVRDD
jgi:hypothetical protein